MGAARSRRACTASACIIIAGGRPYNCDLIVFSSQIVGPSEVHNTAEPKKRGQKKGIARPLLVATLVEHVKRRKSFAYQHSRLRGSATLCWALTNSRCCCFRRCLLARRLQLRAILPVSLAPVQRCMLRAAVKHGATARALLEIADGVLHRFAGREGAHLKANLFDVGMLPNPKVCQSVLVTSSARLHAEQRTQHAADSRASPFGENRVSKSRVVVAAWHIVNMAGDVLEDVHIVQGASCVWNDVQRA